MHIHFHGPLNRVTGSCYELEDRERGVHFLVDCGMQQGAANEAQQNRCPFPFDPRSLDFVVLTHAHLDHSGLIPRLYRGGFEGPVYATRETAALAQAVLNDAARHESLLRDPLYSVEDVGRVRWCEGPATPFGDHHVVGRDVSLRFSRAGHILGAVSVQVVWGAKSEERRITFSGDLGPCGEGEGHLPLLAHRMACDDADYVVIESTYGSTRRKEEERSLEARLAHLETEVGEAVARGGLVILPCFAIGRTQDVLLDLHLLAFEGRLPRVPVYFDAVLAEEVNSVYAEHLGRTSGGSAGSRSGAPLAWLGEALFTRLGLDPRDLEMRVGLVDALREMLRDHHIAQRPSLDALVGWRRLWQAVPEGRRHMLAGPGILVTGGGMCEGGPVQTHLKVHATDPRTTVLLTGYASPSSVAGRLLSLEGFPPGGRTDSRTPLGLTNSPMTLADVRARVRLVRGYSAHADQRGLLAWLFRRSSCAESVTAAGRHVFITHGEATPRRDLEAAIRAEAHRHGVAVEVTRPERRDPAFDLDRGDWLPIAPMKHGGLAAALTAHLGWGAGGDAGMP